MKVLLVGNYLPDRQESMQRFSQMLQTGMKQKGIEVTLVQAPAIINRFEHLPDGCRKWLGYVDKLLLFPPQLKSLAATHDLVHICDQGNSIYLSALAGKPNLVTCHDLLAVQAALGEDTSCPVSITGKVLQKWILRSLQSAQLIACDSACTESVARRLTNCPVKLIDVGLNYPYLPLPEAQSQQRLSAVSGLQQPYILSVGSNESRKNRNAVLRIFARLKDEFPGQLVFAGQPLNQSQHLLSDSLGISQRIVEVVKPADNLLHALYTGAHCLIFPSLAEGFGWPVVEAQASGCPVVISNRGPLPEVSGQAALVYPPENEEEFARGLLSLQDKKLRDDLVARGLKNAQRFNPDIMIEAYLQAYRQILRAQN